MNYKSDWQVACGGAITRNATPIESGALDILENAKQLLLGANRLDSTNWRPIITNDCDIMQQAIDAVRISMGLLPERKGT